MRWIILSLTLIALVGCSTTSPQRMKPKYEKPPSEAITAPHSIDYEALKNSLQMSREREQLGFSEKPFNTCDAGYGYSKSQNCHKEHFVVIHFRLLCRDSEGTISTILTEDDLQPLDRRTVRWTLQGVQGTVQTDSQGYGQIITAATNSQKSQRVKLAVGSEFLYMRANELQRIITPRPWCDADRNY